MKSNLKEKAINLRKTGLSYSEILKEIPVAKSTLSLWLHSVGLSKNQKQRLTEKKLLAISKGWAKRKSQRIEKIALIKHQANLEITKVSKENLWLMGIMLYWAEGAKQKASEISQGVCFSNSDPFMIRIFLKWLGLCLDISEDEIDFDIYIHDNYKLDNLEIAKYWSNTTGFLVSRFSKIYYKKHKLSTNRKNVGDHYHGLLRVRVKKSTDLNRKISSWIETICFRCGIV